MAEVIKWRKASGYWLLVTDSWPEARSEKPAAKNADTRNLTPDTLASGKGRKFRNYFKAM
jgi:hypothetical protein